MHTLGLHVQTSVAVAARVPVHVVPSSDDYVSLEITGEVNAGAAEMALDAPAISTRRSLAEARGSAEEGGCQCRHPPLDRERALE